MTSRGRRTARVPVDAGAAAIEFIVIGVAVLVPIAYLVLAATAVQSAAFASSQAVREAGRAFATAVDPVQGRTRAMAAARLAFADHHLTLPAGSLRISCLDGPCLAPGSVVDVALAWSVPLPWLPGSLADDAPLRVPLTAAHRVPVDDFRDSPGGAT